MSDSVINGVFVGSAGAGIRYSGRDDLVAVLLPESSACAGVFTRNAFRAAPVVVAQEHLRLDTPRCLLINSGNANAGTGSRGLADARASCLAAAETFGCRAQQVLPFSTGVIGEFLAVERLVSALPGLASTLRADGWDRAARAIMTTDTVPKRVTRRVQLGSETATITGIAKGAGMICPDMATMLAFLATDAAVDRAVLVEMLHVAVETSFNAITIDGDTSTNDACILAAVGTLGNRPVDSVADDPGVALLDAVQAVCQDLAAAIVRDGEGASKLVAIEINGAANSAEARRVGDCIAHSLLVKTALFASDPNWGRILAAVGRAGIPDLEIDAVSIRLNDCEVVVGGERSPTYLEAEGRRVMAADSFSIGVSLGRGQAGVRLLTSDLSYDYVRINAEYRT